MNRHFIQLFLFTILCWGPIIFPLQGQPEADPARNYLFFLHNRFTEEHSSEEPHPEYGIARYTEILHEFEKENFIVISEKRPPNTDVRVYARKVVAQIDSLLLTGVPPGKICVAGISKGGYIAQYVSTFLANPNVNFVLVGCYRESDLQRFNDIDFCGNILTIYDRSDEYGISAMSRKETSRLLVSRFCEIELDTHLKHGFLFQPLPDWIGPSVLWASQAYEEVEKISKKKSRLPDAVMAH